MGADFHLVDGSSSYIIPIGATAAAVFGRKTTRLVSGSLLTLPRGQWPAAPWHVLLTLVVYTLASIQVEASHLGKGAVWVLA